MRLHTHSMGIISQWLAMNAVSECCFTNAVLIPDRTKRYGYSDELYIQKYKYKIQSMWYEVTDVHDMQGFQ